MNNFYKIDRAKLINYGTVACEAVASGSVTGFLPEQSAAIAAELTAVRDLLAAENLDAVEARAASLAATAKAQERHKQAAKMLSDLKFAMRGVDSSPAEFESVGFKPPAEPRRFITPQRPTGLAANGVNGHVNLAWDGNNDPGSVSYIIFGRMDRSDAFSIIGMCTTQKFVHQGVPPGQFYEYQIRAQASRGLVSDCSNTAVVYSRG